MIATTFVVDGRPTMSDYVCGRCGQRHGVGCLHLSRADEQAAARLIAIAGTHGGGHVSLTTTPVRSVAARDTEPTTSIRCGCSRLIDLPTYLVEWCERNAAPIPNCSHCARAS